MSNLHKRAMEAVLEAAELDITQTLKENDIRDRHSEEADDVMFDVAILHAYRIFVRICERQGLTVDAPLFADMAADLAEEMAAEAEGD
ncbi:hypothetical protein [Arenibaculum sp.]|uniref:hypothetical protein n=1 Tax=Arenibaculum sp. TaxID=2865862 RepID=UPI002E12AE09|nr:hypothetical protein [Arenibaculum sp.]